MLDQSVLLDQVRRYWEYAGKDADRAHEIYHDDAVLEFPQSGERFEGVANFREWRRKYPADLRFRIRRMGLGRSGDHVSRRGVLWIRCHASPLLGGSVRGRTRSCVLVVRVAAIMNMPDADRARY